jgi:hypothetical protein
MLEKEKAAEFMFEKVVKYLESDGLTFLTGYDGACQEKFCKAICRALVDVLALGDIEEQSEDPE